MRGARHPASSLGTGMLAVALVALLASGCGSSGTNSGEGSTKTTAPRGAMALTCAGAPAGVEALRVSGVDCAAGRQVASAWTEKNGCGAVPGASRTSCTAGIYHCLGIATERGLAISCARPGRSISFLAKRH
jgi:hypothetical protein